MGERIYLEIPGSGTHQLPPLLIRRVVSDDISLESIVELVDAEEMIPPATLDRERPEHVEQLRYDLATQIALQYRGLVEHWHWGDSVLEWIRQCEITFEASSVLRRFLHPDVWPNANRSSFVELLREKEVPTGGVGVEHAVGLRLTFRQPPPIDCCTNQFLFFLNSPVADSAYHAWAHLNTETPANLPPDRFAFEVHELTLPA
jgi:hypothetical protein